MCAPELATDAAAEENEESDAPLAGVDNGDTLELCVLKLGARDSGDQQRDMPARLDSEDRFVPPERRPGQISGHGQRSRWRD